MPIKPGTDPALGMAMLNAVIASEVVRSLSFMRDKTCAPACAVEILAISSRATDFGEEGRRSCPSIRSSARCCSRREGWRRCPRSSGALCGVWDADKDAWGLINEVKVANPAMGGQLRG